MSDVEHLWCLKRKRLLAVGSPALIEALAEEHRTRSGPCAVTTSGTPPWQKRHLTLVSSQSAIPADVIAAACASPTQTSARLVGGERLPHALSPTADL